MLYRQRESINSDEYGNVTIKRTQDVEPLMDGVKMMSDSQLHAPERDLNGRLYLGSIDFITAQNWAKECGHRMFSKEWREYAKKQLMSREYSRFRADTVRRYG